MWCYRGITIGLIFTVVAMCYVHQRVEIIKTGYTLQENKKYFSHLVDQNSKLMYNLSRLESPKNLLSSIDIDSIEFAGQRAQLSDAYLLTRIDQQKEYVVDGLIERFMDVFTVRAEASSCD